MPAYRRQARLKTPAYRLRGQASGMTRIKIAIYTQTLISVFVLVLSLCKSVAE